MLINDMDDKMLSDDSIKDGQHEITRWTRDEPPSHYTFKINSYSVLSEIEMKICESGDFDVDGYKWKLNLYPKGDKNVEDHISLYLAISNKDNLSLGWEVRVIFKFFIFDQIRDKYLTIQEKTSHSETTEELEDLNLFGNRFDHEVRYASALDGKIRKYYKMKNEYGITNLISHKAFNEASNGYLVDDCCTFGVEISIIKSTNKGESFTMIKEPQLDHFLWYIYPYSSYTGELYTSQPFTVKGRKWRLMIYPNGLSGGKSTHISLFLRLDESESIPVGKRIYAKYFLGLYNYKTINYFEKSSENWYNSPRYGHGFHEFLPIKEVKDTSKTYLQNDALFVKARIVAMSTVEDF